MDEHIIEALFANIYLLDPTHKRPIHPETMRYFFEQAGFKDVAIEYITHVSDEYRLKKIALVPEMSAREREIAEVNNYNVEMLNQIVYGPENYAAIGKK